MGRDEGDDMDERLAAFGLGSTGSEARLGKLKVTGDGNDGDMGELMGREGPLMLCPRVWPFGCEGVKMTLDRLPAATGLSMRGMRPGMAALGEVVLLNVMGSWNAEHALN